MDREFDELHIIEVPNQFKVSNKLKVTDDTNYTVRLAGSISSSFILGESNELSKFSMYTIIPEGWCATRQVDILNIERFLAFAAQYWAAFLCC